MGRPKLNGAVAAATFVNCAVETACLTIPQDDPQPRRRGDLPGAPLARQAGALATTRADLGAALAAAVTPPQIICSTAYMEAGAFSTQRSQSMMRERVTHASY